MSVQANQYICYGYLVDYSEARDHLVEQLGEEGYEELCDKYHDSAFKEDIVEVHGCSMIWDGMNGEYVFFGKIFDKAKTGDMLGTTVIPEVSVRDQIITEHEFNRIFGGGFDVKPQLILLTHYR